MKTLLHYDALPFKQYLMERILTENEFEFFITSGPECDMEIETNVNNLLFTLKKDRDVEYNCYLEDGSLLEIFTTKVEGYKNKDGIKFGLRSISAPEKIFQNENLRNMLGVVLVAKPNDNTEMLLIENLLKDSGYHITNKGMQVDGLPYYISKMYNYFVVAGEFSIDTETTRIEVDRINRIVLSFIEEKNIQTI